MRYLDMTKNSNNDIKYLQLLQKHCEKVSKDVTGELAKYYERLADKYAQQIKAFKPAKKVSRRK
jgi:translation initiation factor 2 alpha subunit (eIF-2alpha)